MSILILHASSSLFPQEQLLQAYQTRTEIPSSSLFPRSPRGATFQILTTDHSAPPKSFLFSSVLGSIVNSLGMCLIHIFQRSEGQKCGSLILVVGLYLGPRIPFLERMRS